MKNSSVQPKPTWIVLLAILALAGSRTAAEAVNPLTGSQNHGLSLQTDGSVCTDGENLYGQLGDGTAVDRKSPVRVAGVAGAVQVATGYYHTLAVKSDGTVWAWGFDGNGQLGDNSTFAKPTPIQVPGLTGIIAVAAGDRHSLALKSDGTVWSWRNNGNGQLGDGTNTAESIPVQVIQLNGVVAISAGAAFSIALKSDGTVWGWGVNGAGQLGDGTNMQRLSPVQVAGLSGVMSISAGATHTLALKTDGTVWGWGYNGYGELGDGSSGNFRFNIVRAGTLTGVVSIASGDNHSLAVKSDGTVWAFGLNNSGQLGDATNVQRLTPVQVSGFTGGVAVGAGLAHSLALKSDGSQWAWGSNSNGQLGNGTLANSLLPVASSACASGTFQGAGKSALASRLSATQSYSLAVKGDGTVVGSGDNTYGQLGDGTTTNRSSAVAAAGLSGIVGISAGWYHGLAVKNDGTVRAWGFGGNGQLGDGTVISKPTPIQVPGLTGIVAVAAGDRHSLALKNDGTVWSWGNNGNGQLGDGTNTARTSPVQVIQLSGVVGISAGVSFSVALKSDGTVWGWGVNGAGQLRDGTNTQRLSPVQVAGLTGAISITAGPATHTLALKSDGTVWGWGYNGYGELGDGSTGNFRYNIVRASDLTSIVAMATVDNHSLAVKSDGTVFSFGLNNSGELGDGSITQRLVPVPVTGFSGGLAVAAGTTHSWALKNDGFVWAWGSNSAGQFGVATPASSTVPVMGPFIGLPPPPSLSIGKTHSGNFTKGQIGATYLVVVSNGASAGPTTAAVTVTETIPTGLTLTGMAGTGWICSSNTCTRVDTLNGAVSFPAITVTVNVASNAPAQVTNQVSVSGGGSATANGSDVTTIVTLPTCTYSINPMSASPDGTGGRSSVTVTTQAGCAWTAKPNDPWISNVTSSGIGSGPAFYTVAPNTGQARTGSATIAGQTLTIMEAAGPPDTTPPFGSFDTPLDNTNNVIGAIGVTGWALDNAGVTKVEIYRDALNGETKGNFGYIFIGTAVFVKGARPDVQALYPNLPNANRAGWGYQMLTNFLPGSGNGTFKIHAIAFDGSNNTIEIGTGKTIICANASAAKPFGTIDTPGQGETISGNNYINFGWALTPGQAFMIPINGSTIGIVIDGVPVGSPTYNQFRSDIASLFPGFTNSQGAVGYLFVDTTKLLDGVHSISWNVFDNAMRGEGLGSRYFSVANGGTANVPEAKRLRLIPRKSSK